MIQSILSVAMGGAVGAVLRWVFSRMLADEFPWGTLAVNMAGCFLIGLISELASRGLMSSDVRLLLVTGFCGGFTTFSTFSKETLDLASGGDAFMAAGYAALSLFVGLWAVWVGGFVGRLM